MLRNLYGKQGEVKNKEGTKREELNDGGKTEDRIQETEQRALGWWDGGTME